MDFLKNLEALKPMQVLKIAGVALLGLILLVFAFQLVSSSLKSLAGPMMGGVAGMSAPGYGLPGEGGGSGYDVTYDAMYAREESANMPQLSTRNVAIPYPPQGGTPTGDSAEEFEVTQYSATIETRRLESVCAAFDELKTRDDVIFESANTYDRGCNFSFKVKHASVEEVLAWLEDFDPKELSENTYTIKRQIDDFTSEAEVLEKKRDSIDETLESALNAYNEITRLATNTQNAEALAKIIDSKIGIIERLTQERININEQLDRLARAKAEQLGRLEYTYFNVNVYENKFVDAENLWDSWKNAVRATIQEINTILQEVTLGLVALLFLVGQWALYALIVLFIAKYGWKLGKYIWFR